jgi:protein-tyrosine phosphatase
MTADAPTQRHEERPARVLTVCLGNICRSPTAEAALVEAALESGLDLEVASAGTGDWHLGQAPNPPMRAAAEEVGLRLRGTAQQVDPDLLAWADLVLVMDRQNLVDVERMARDAELPTPIRLFRDFDPDPDDDEVPDPYGGDRSGFEEVVTICRRTARSIVASWPAPLGST